MELEVGMLMTTIVVGLIIGIFPLLLGLARKDTKGGVAGMIFCAFGALLIGLMGAFIAAILAVFLIMFRTKRKPA